MRVQFNEIWKLYLLAYLYMMTNEIKLKCGKNSTNEFTNSKQRMILCRNLYYLFNLSILNFTIEFQLPDDKFFFNIFEDICLNTMVQFKNIQFENSVK